METVETNGIEDFEGALAAYGSIDTTCFQWRLDVFEHRVLLDQVI